MLTHPTSANGVKIPAEGTAGATTTEGCARRALVAAASLLLSMSTATAALSGQGAVPGVASRDQNVPPVQGTAALEDAAAQYDRGLAYLAGDGVAPDPAAGAAWLRRAADQGHAGAQNDLALLYVEGLGVPQDYSQAVAWWRRAAEQGFAEAQNSLGVMYDNGTGVEADRQQALAWYRRAAGQGHAAAQNNLGLMYEIGRGVSLDYAEALKWYRLSAEQGWPGAQANLGLAYVGGVGVPADTIEGDKWLRLAAQRALGDDQVRYSALREALEEKMSAEDVVEAWQRAREWNRRFALR